MKPQRSLVVAMTLAMTLIGASLGTAWILRPRPTTTITAGMSMAKAASIMNQRGLVPQQMQMAEPHQAYDLPDGRAVVLVGQQTVDAISIIAKPATPKSARVTATVPTITF